MNILHALHELLGQAEHAGNSFQGASGNQVRFGNPTGQVPQQPQAGPQNPGQLQAHVAGPQQLGNNTAAAHAYARNPTAPQFIGVDPAQFGYGPDNTGSLGVAANAFRANLGVPTGSMPQGNSYNPGFIPMQGSQGAQAYPQMHAYGGVQRPGDQMNPQDNRRQQYWQ